MVPAAHALTCHRGDVRHNMPFGAVGTGEFGTYFIGYAAAPDVIEQMLTNMFVGKLPGNHDRILDFSTAVTRNQHARGRGAGLGQRASGFGVGSPTLWSVWRSVWWNGSSRSSTCNTVSSS